MALYRGHMGAQLEPNKMTEEKKDNWLYAAEEVVAHLALLCGVVYKVRKKTKTQQQVELHYEIRGDRANINLFKEKMVRISLGRMPF